MRVARGWGLDMRIRLIAGGREIHEDEPLQHISKVLHCIATSSEDICKDCCRLAEQEFERQHDDVYLYQQEDWVRPPLWVDVVNPHIKLGAKRFALTFAQLINPQSLRLLSVGYRGVVCSRAVHR